MLGLQLFPVDGAKEGVGDDLLEAAINEQNQVITPPPVEKSITMHIMKSWVTYRSASHPRRSIGFLFKNPLRMEAALTESDRGIRIVFSRMTWNR